MASSTSSGSSSSSSGDPVSLNPAKLETAGTHYADLESKVKDIHDRLTRRLDALGQPWGDDSTGKQFTDGPSGYFATRDSIITPPQGSLDSLRSLIRSYGDDTAGAAKAYRNHEDSAVADFLSAISTEGSGSGSSATGYLHQTKPQ